MDKINKISRYKEAGVDIDKANKLIEIIRPYIKETFREDVISDIGGFSGIFSLRERLKKIKDPVLFSSTDGVGTKLKIAFVMDKHDTVGIDLVAMCVNDIIVQGATPLFMLDYLAMGKLDLKVASEIIKGICKGCIEANCSLIGGETAEMPSMYKEGEYDLAGFVVGIAERDEIIDGSKVKAGDQIIGLRSSGLHSNGYSLVRKIFLEELEMKLDEYVEDLGRSLGEELLEPTRIYVKIVEDLKKRFDIHGISHITGGGFIENIPRILPDKCKAIIRKFSWRPHPIFKIIQEKGNIPEYEMMRTFNCGIGMVLIVKDSDAKDMLSYLKEAEEDACLIGWIEERKESDPPIQITD